MTPIAILIGPPGAGKSTIGRQLARRLGVGFRDTDSDIEAIAQMSVSDIFVTEGEPHFRLLEKAAVETAVATHDGVLSLGGGAVMDAETQKVLLGQPIIWLDVDLVNAVHRVGFNTSRPMMQVNPRATMRKLMEERSPVYEKVSTWRIDTSNSSPSTTVDRIMEVLK